MSEAEKATRWWNTQSKVERAEWKEHVTRWYTTHGIDLPQSETEFATAAYGVDTA